MRAAVLRAAERYGIGHLVHVARPSSRLPRRPSRRYFSIEFFSEIMPPAGAPPSAEG